MNNKFKPKVNIGKFLSAQFALEDYIHYFFEHMPDKHSESIKKESLSKEQLALYSYYLVEGQVVNGGFVQAIYNGYLKYFEDAIKAMELIGQEECKTIIEEAKKIGERSKIDFWIQRFKGLFRPELYDKYSNLDKLDNAFYKIYKGNDILFRNYIWKNRAFLMSSDSTPKLGDSGHCIVYHPVGVKYQEYTLKESGIDGEYKEYNSNGSLKRSKFYNNGVYTNESSEYYDDGVLRTKTFIHNGKISTENYYPNGQIEQRYFVDLITKQRLTDKGEYKKWFENGNIHIDRPESDLVGHSNYLRYYETGQIEMVAISKNKKFYVMEYYLVNGDKVLSDGNGFVKSIKNRDGVTVITTESYRGGLRNGEYKVTKNGIVDYIHIYKDGERIK